MKIQLKLMALAITAGALFFAHDVKAQTTPASTFGLTLGVETGLPTGNVSNYAVFALGGTIRLRYGVSNDLALTFATGGDHFFMKTMPGTNQRYTSYGVGPIKAGIKYFFVPNIYFGAEAGLGVEVLPSGYGSGQKKLLLYPALGYANNHWDAGIFYESLTGQQNNYGILGIGLAYGFKL